MLKGSWSWEGASEEKSHKKRQARSVDKCTSRDTCIQWHVMCLDTRYTLNQVIALNSTSVLLAISEATKHKLTLRRRSAYSHAIEDTLRSLSGLRLIRVCDRIIIILQSRFH